MTNQCQHGQLARVCLICEQVAEIERLTATVAGLRESANLRVRYHAAELADVTAERDEAREQVEIYASERDEARAAWSNRTRELERMEAQVAALEVDAGRWRKLRAMVRGERHLGTGHNQGFAFPSRFELPPLGDIMRGSVGQHLDAAVDAALAARKGEA